MYQITLKSQVENFLIKKLDRKTQIKISAKIDTLARDPFAPTNLDKLSGGVEQISQREFARAVDAGHSEINSLAAQLEIKDPKDQQFLHDLVAASIQRSPEDMQRWNKTGDIAVVRKHFNAVSEGFLRNLTGKRDAVYGKAKDKTVKLPPRMPQGGAPAVTAKKQPMNDEERANAGFEVFSSVGEGN